MKFAVRASFGGEMLFRRMSSRTEENNLKVFYLPFTKRPLRSSFFLLFYRRVERVDVERGCHSGSIMCVYRTSSIIS